MHTEKIHDQGAEAGSEPLQSDSDVRTKHNVRRALDIRTVSRDSVLPMWQFKTKVAAPTQKEKTKTSLTQNVN